MSETTNTHKVAGATYVRADGDYFERRTLRRSAGIWGLWGLAVAAVISGDFSGWNFGIGFAGFGGMLIAFAILVVMYYGMIFSIGEMSAAMLRAASPHEILDPYHPHMEATLPAWMLP